MNAGGLAEGIAESELFGHVKGAFTDARADRIGCFEMADEGTLFLDEIANMPIRLQAKLLRVLQTGEMQRVGSSRLSYVNARILSATNADLHTEVEAGRFRQDLLFRLNGKADCLSLIILVQHQTSFISSSRMTKKCVQSGTSWVAYAAPNDRMSG